MNVNDMLYGRVRLTEEDVALIRSMSVADLQILLHRIDQGGWPAAAGAMQEIRDEKGESYPRDRGQVFPEYVNDILKKGPRCRE